MPIRTQVHNLSLESKRALTNLCRVDPSTLTLLPLLFPVEGIYRWFLSLQYYFIEIPVFDAKKYRTRSDAAF